MIRKVLDAITPVDLNALVENKVEERRTLEFKQDLPGKKDEDKREYKADASSFANTIGGDLVFGIRAIAGVAVEVCGVACDDSDQEKLRLEQILLAGIEPRMSGVTTRAIEVAPKRYVFVQRIAESFQRPHRIAENRRFYARNSSGKYELDMDQLRTEFLAMERVGDRLRSFRAERVALVRKRAIPVELAAGPAVVLHVVPLSHGTGARFDLTALQIERGDLAPIGADSPGSFSFNFDGVLTVMRQGARLPALGYVQVFRSGAIESATTLNFRAEPDVRDIPSQNFEEDLIAALGRALRVCKRLQVAPPLAVLLSVINAEGFIYTTRRGWQASRPFDRPDLLAIEALVNDLDAAADAILHESFNMIWNAAGFPVDDYYDANGRWKPAI